MNHRHRCQIAVDLAQRCVTWCLRAGDDEFDARRLERVHGVRQTCLDDRGRRKVGDVQNRAGAFVGGHRRPQHVIAQPCHHTHTGIGFPCQQSDFEVCCVVISDANYGASAGDFGGVELVGGSELDDVHTGVVELLDDRGRQRVVTADDDVAAHGYPRFGSSGMTPPLLTLEFCSYDYRAPYPFMPAQHRTRGETR